MLAKHVFSQYTVGYLSFFGKSATIEQVYHLRLAYNVSTLLVGLGTHDDHTILG